jgi:hypothetical protein
MNNLLFSKRPKVPGLVFRVAFLVSVHRFKVKDKESIKELKIEYLWMPLSEAQALLPLRAGGFTPSF